VLVVQADALDASVTPLVVVLPLTTQVRRGFGSGALPLPPATGCGRIVKSCSTSRVRSTVRGWATGR
jgi:hypothetical protein